MLMRLHSVKIRSTYLAGRYILTDGAQYRKVSDMSFVVAVLVSRLQAGANKPNRCRMLGDERLHHVFHHWYRWHRRNSTKHWLWTMCPGDREVRSQTATSYHKRLAKATCLSRSSAATHVHVAPSGFTLVCPGPIQSPVLNQDRVRESITMEMLHHKAWTTASPEPNLACVLLRAPRLTASPFAHPHCETGSTDTSSPPLSPPHVFACFPKTSLSPNRSAHS